MAVLSRSLVFLTLALSVFAASTTETTGPTRVVARGGGGEGGGSNGGGNGNGWGNGGGDHGGGGEGGGGWGNGGGNGGGDGNGWGNGGGNGGGHGGGSGGGNGGGWGSGGGGEPHHPEPSHHPKPGPKRRALNTLTGASIAEEICPGEAYGCPIAPAGALSALPVNLDDWLAQGFYCADTQNDLTDCGGCAALDAKHDCTRIANAKSVSCVAGSCVVDSCIDNFTLYSNTCTAN